MKIYLVVDEWQYDGGCYIYGAYYKSNDALAAQQIERRRFSDYNREYAAKYPEQTRPVWSDHRLEAITIMELEVK